MKIEVSAVFIKDADSIVRKELKIENEKTIKDIIREMKITNEAYAHFILNGDLVEETEIVRNEDSLLVMPVFSGG